MQDVYRLLEAEKTENLAVSYHHPSYILETELAAAMGNCDREAALELLGTINRLERARLADSPLQSLRYSLVCGCTCYTRTAISAGVGPELAFCLSDLYIREIGRTSRVSSLEELEKSMLLDFIRLIEDEKKAGSYVNSAVNRICAYISANVQRRLTLKDIAAEVGMHPVYVSSLFRTETGRNISEYIEAQRISAIKKFLSGTDMKLLEIAELFSFSSAAHFSSYFKNAAGMTPREYRASSAGKKRAGI